MLNEKSAPTNEPEGRIEILAESIYNFIKNNDVVTRYKIDLNYPDYEEGEISETIRSLLEQKAIKYCPTGIELGSRPYQRTAPATLSELTPDCNQSKLELIELLDQRMEVYLKSSTYYNPHDRIAEIIGNMPESQKKEVLRRAFLSDDDTSEALFKDEKYSRIIDDFCESFDCDEGDINLFTEYFLPSNLFVYAFNRPVSYYRMMCLKYEQGEMSPELILHDMGNESILISTGSDDLARLYDRIKVLTNGYMDLHGGNRYASFTECFLFLMNDYSVGIELLEFLAYSMHGLKLHSDSNRIVPSIPTFDEFITTDRSIKYISSENIHSIFENLELIYDGCVVTPKKMFKNNRELLFMHYIEDLSELKQVLNKYGPYTESNGYICFNANLESAVSDFAINNELYDWSLLPRAFVKRYGGNEGIIASLAESIKLESDNANKLLSNAQLETLTKELESYQWISANNAKDVFEFKCGCADRFSSYNMHILGFNMDGDAYYRTNYQNLRDCLRSNEFVGDELLVDRRFKISMECESFKGEVDYFIRNLMWIPISETKYLNLRSNENNALYRAAKECKPILKSMCDDGYLTAYHLKNEGTGVEYIDKHDFGLIFYDSLLVSTGANRISISRQHAYHNGDGGRIGAPDLIEYIVRSKDGESDVISIKDILETEYGFSVSESQVKDLINRSNCIHFKETGAVYQSEESYRETRRK